MIIYHTMEANICSYNHSTCSSYSLNNKYKYRDEMVKITYLIKNSFRNQLRRSNIPPNHRPVCSLISQQHYHSRAGHDSPRNKELTDLHIAKRVTHNSAKPTRLVLSGEQQISQANRVGFIRPSRSWERIILSWWAHWRAVDTNTRAILDSRTPTHTQHKEVSAFSATQSLRPWSSLQCSSGVVEKKSSLVALSVWFSTHQVYQAP